MEEYKKNIFSIIDTYYKSKIGKFSEKMIYLLNDEFSEYDGNDDIIICVMDFLNFENSYFNILSYINRIEKKFYIVGYNIEKIIDKEGYKKSFIISFTAINKNKYKNEYEEYFEEDIVKYKKLKDKLIKSDILNKNLCVEINNLTYGRTSTSFDEIYNICLDKNISYKNKIIKKLQFGRNLSNFTRAFKGLKINSIDYSDYDKTYSYNEEEFDNIKYINNIKKIKNNLFEENNVFIVLNTKENDFYFKKFKSKNIKVFTFGKNDTNDIKDLGQLNIIFKNKKYLFVDEFDTDKSLLDCNCIYIDSKVFHDLEESEILKYIINKHIDAFANYDERNVINVMCSTFLNFEGTNYYSGGAERYLIDLHEVCKSIGYKMRIYQDSNFDYFRYYRDIEVVGLSHDSEDFSFSNRKNVREKFASMVLGNSKLNIYSSFMECMENPISPSIGISHGVAWDSIINSYNVKSQEVNIDGMIVNSAKKCDKIVSVDTNTANWFQTIDYKLGNTTQVIPNYVDINEFSKGKEIKKDNIIIVYPRRLYEPRGMYMLLNILDKLFKKYKNIEVHFVGKGFDKDVKNIENKIKQYPNKIKLYNMPPERMHEVYKLADISLIPTLYSEGTSLSCLESMATGNAVIATRIGGLTDLVINNFNGKLIEPNENSLFEAICSFIDNPKLMDKCKNNAVLVAKEFNKDIWIEKWKDVINNFAECKSKLKNIEYKKIKIYVNDKDVNSKKLNTFIFEKLKDNCVVFIVTVNNLKKKNSYGRLQYINSKDEFYCNFDNVFVSKNYKGKIFEDKYENLSLGENNE